MEDLTVKVIENELILEKIIEKLPAKDLVSASLVSRKWYSIVYPVLKGRNSQNMLLMHYPKKFWVNYEPKAQGKVLEQTQRNLLRMVHNCSNIVKIAAKESARGVAMENVFNRLLIIPGCVITYTTCWKMTEELRLQSIFPKLAHEIYIHASPGIICSPEMRSGILELERDRDHFRVDTMASCFFNKYFTDYKLTITNWSDPDSPKPVFDDPEYPLKCLIVISRVMELDNFDLFISEIPKVALGGAVVNKLQYKEPVTGECKDSRLLTIAFSGKNVQAASIVFNDRLDREYEFKRLQDFKQSLKFDPNQHDDQAETVGFLFICAGRGRYYYDKKDNVESDQLKKVFPNVLFTGVFGQGEYGHTYCGSENESIDSPCDDKCQMNHYLSYTSVVVVVHFSKSEN